MPEAMKNCEYFLVQYVPTALRETRIAVGLFLFETPERLVGHRITRDWRTVRCLDPQADVRFLEDLSAHFERLSAESAPDPSGSNAGSPAESLHAQLRRMEQDYAGSLQISPARGVQTADPQQELERLFEEHVAPRRPLRPPPALRPGSRPWIRAQLSEALRRYNLWDRFEKDVSVEQYTAPGDAFRIDFGGRPNGVAHYLHALSLERDWTQAKLLGYTFWRIREKTEARLTAIVADADSTLPSVESCRRILTEARIAVEPLSRLDPFFASVREEFRRV